MRHNTFFMLFILSVIVLGLCGCSKDQEMLESAQSYFDNGNYKQTILLCQQIVNEEPSKEILSRTKILMTQSYAGLAYDGILKHLPRLNKLAALMKLGELKDKYYATVFKVKFDSLYNVTESYLLENDPSYMLKTAQYLASNKNFEQSTNILNLINTKFAETEWSTKAQSEMLSIRKTQIQTEIEDIESQINSANQDIASAQKYLNENKVINLTAFMVSVLEGNYYEIALLRWSYYGAIPSENHAILLTKETTFNSKGKFTMTVRKTGIDLPIKLKEDFGSFTQEWTVYEEVDSETKRTISEKKKLIADKKSEIQSFQNQLKELHFSADHL
jgi:vacuolar-type H+-ATPase subunit I/STV1